MISALMMKSVPRISCFNFSRSANTFSSINHAAADCAGLIITVFNHLFIQTLFRKCLVQSHFPSTEKRPLERMQGNQMVEHHWFPCPAQYVGYWWESDTRSAPPPIDYPLSPAHLCRAQLRRGTLCIVLRTYSASSSPLEWNIGHDIDLADTMFLAQLLQAFDLIFQSIDFVVEVMAIILPIIR